MQCQYHKVSHITISVRWKFFVTLDTVGLVELLMFGTWCNTPVFRGMIFLLDIDTKEHVTDMGY